MNEPVLPKRTIRVHYHQKRQLYHSSVNHSSLNLVNVRRRSNYTTGLALDITLFVISILIILTLSTVVIWFCCKRRKELKKLHDDNFKIPTKKSKRFPDIAVIRSGIFSSSDDGSTDTNEDSLSAMSSIWDTPSQKFDRTFLEQKVTEENRMEATHQQLNKMNSMDLNQSCCFGIVTGEKEEGVKDKNKLESIVETEGDYVAQDDSSRYLASV